VIFLYTIIIYRIAEHTKHITHNKINHTLTDISTIYIFSLKYVYKAKINFAVVNKNIIIKLFRIYIILDIILDYIYSSMIFKLNLFLSVKYIFLSFSYFKMYFAFIDLF